MQRLDSTITLATVDWSQLLATAIGGVIAVLAAWFADRRKAKAEVRARTRLARGSVRAWRDDLYRAEEVLGAAITRRRWDPAELSTPLADTEDYKEVSREASWMTWGRLATAQHRLDRTYRDWNESRELDEAEIKGLEDLLLLTEDARLRLARELDEKQPEDHPILSEPALRHLNSSDYAVSLEHDAVV